MICHNKVGKKKAHKKFINYENKINLAKNCFNHSYHRLYLMLKKKLLRFNICSSLFKEVNKIPFDYLKTFLKF